MSDMWPHRRYNPLKDEWLIVSAQRCNRPWSGATEKTQDESVPAYDPTNPLAPGAMRNGVQNEDYQSTYIFENNFPALLPQQPIISEEDRQHQHPLFQHDHARGLCKVMCFNRRSDKQLATMTLEEIELVIDSWRTELEKLSRQYMWVQIFENKGALVGCSNPHPHCQIWASEFMPVDPSVRDRTQKEYMRKFGKPMLVDYVREEMRRKERMVVENDHFIVVVPYWAMWPYETMLLPKRAVERLMDLNAAECRSLAQIIKLLLIKYDNLFQCSFPYSMGWYGAPTGRFMRENCSHWQLHAVYFPPLLRSATIKKFMAGYELLCEPQRDITPEMAAEKLRSVSNVHYKQAGHV